MLRKRNNGKNQICHKTTIFCNPRFSSLLFFNLFGSVARLWRVFFSEIAFYFVRTLAMDAPLGLAGTDRTIKIGIRAFIVPIGAGSRVKPFERVADRLWWLRRIVKDRFPDSDRTGQ
jgi:hypothetical protein